MNTIICEVKEFFEETCNSLLVEAKKDPIIDNGLINKITFWDRTYSEMKITFIDLIKGIISCELAAYTALIFENKKLQEKFLVLLRNFIFNKSWNFWINRCLKQKEKERKLKINLKKVKENLNEDKYIDPNRKFNQLNLFSGLESLRSNIYFGTNMQGFIVLVNYALCSLLLFLGVSS
ncbi:uncharacterized protein OCT59_018231 [Rhizophagus irregularis]|uniref:uncharacterized protein n=1 Tax=Rhizophagus irregularis TaxID=588596 RepID=UPI00331D057D|nr:hypothetical protein OCT59_018231 [Rhizophagus irregularis]